MSLLTKVGQFAASTSSGDQAITGVGFQGKAIILWGSRVASTGFSANIQFFIGCATSSSARWAFADGEDDNVVNGDSGRTSQNSACVRMISDATTPTIDGVADFVSFDSDGFTINWSDPPAIAALINYVVIGGTDVVNAKAGDFTLATSGASQSSTDPGFQPNFLMLVNIGLASHTGSTSGYMCIGAASGASDQACALTRSNDNSTARMKWQKSGRITLGTATAGTADHEAALSSFDATGFTLSVSDVPSASRIHGYLAIQFANTQCKVGVETQKTSTGTKDTALAFDPSAVMFWGVNAVNNASIDTTDNRLSVGAGDGTTEAGAWFQSSGGNPSNANRSIYDDKALRHATQDSTVDAEADLSVGTQKFTLNWTTADATAREFVYMALGNPTPTATFVPKVTVF